MHLSKLTLDPRHEDVQRDLAVPYELHRTLENAFPDAESERHRARHGVLFRVEEPVAGGVPVLVQSVTKPDWGLLPPGYTQRIDGPKPFAPAFAAGQRLRFRLAANPVRRVRLDGKPHPRRLPLVHPRAKEGVESGYLDWLDRQAEASGFTVEEVADVPFRIAPKRRVGSGAVAKAHIPHFGVRFDGMLHVTDPDALVTALRSGIGPAKSFGFGLLSLAAVQ